MLATASVTAGALPAAQIYLQMQSSATDAAVAASILSPEITVATAVIGASSVTLLGMYQRHQLDRLAKQLVLPQSLDSAFQREYARKIVEKDEDCLALWTRCMDYLKVGLNSSELQKMPKVKPSDIELVTSLLEDQIPKLRREVVPNLKQR